MAIDQALYNLDNAADNAAVQLRRDKKAAADNNASPAEEEGSGGMSLRERLARKRNLIDSSKEQIKEAVESKVKKLWINQAINVLWEALIPSWGLALLPLNLLIFKRLLTGDKKSARLIDVIGVLAIDLLVFFALIGFSAIIIWLADNIVLKAGAWVLDLTS
jgi:hypothetical protein